MIRTLHAVHGQGNGEIGRQLKASPTAPTLCFRPHHSTDKQMRWPRLMGSMDANSDLIHQVKNPPGKLQLNITGGNIETESGHRYSLAHT
jgi:hypothetical protein